MAINSSSLPGSASNTATETTCSDMICSSHSVLPPVECSINSSTHLDEAHEVGRARRVARARDQPEDIARRQHVETLQFVFRELGHALDRKSCGTHQRRRAP